MLWSNMQQVMLTFLAVQETYSLGTSIENLNRKNGYLPFNSFFWFENSQKRIKTESVLKLLCLFGVNLQKNRSANVLRQQNKSKSKKKYTNLEPFLA